MEWFSVVSVKGVSHVTFRYLCSGDTGSPRQARRWFLAARVHSGMSAGRSETRRGYTDRRRRALKQQLQESNVSNWIQTLTSRERQHTLQSPLTTYCPLSLSLFLSSDWRFRPRTDMWRMTEASLGRGGTTGGVSS